VASVYNRHAYIDEKRDALEQWANHLQNELCDTKKSIENEQDVFSAPAPRSSKPDPMILTELAL
jgi:hypothetical protein